MKIKKRRRLRNKTDYKARTSFLKSEKSRVVFRKTNKYIIGQYIKSKEAQDSVITGVFSKDLMEYGWPEQLKGSLKSIPAAYLTGYLLGKNILEKQDKAEAILDIGLIRSLKKSRIYSFLKGVVDAGVKISGKQELFPDEKRIKGNHLKSTISEIFDKIKSSIDKKFA